MAVSVQYSISAAMLNTMRLAASSRLRKILGAAKWGLIERWDQHWYRRSQALRQRQRIAVANLPAVCSSGRAEVDVCMLCGHRYLDMGIAATWSLLRFLPNWRLGVFSDGTLTAEDVDQWRSVVPSLHVIDRHVVTAAINRELGDLKHIQEIWRRNPFSTQLVDAHFAGDSRFVALLDSDVLCFREPTELIGRARSRENVISWNCDLGNSYCVAKGDLEARVGYALPERVNAGLMLIPRFGRGQFTIMEKVLDQIGQITADPAWMSTNWLAQTTYATMIPRFPGSAPLSADYAVSTRRSRPAVMRHYVSVPSIRARFFTEGIPEILRQAAVHSKRQTDSISLARATACKSGG
jgi:hypothetical protein